MAIKKKELPDAAQRIRGKLARWHNIPFGIQGQPGSYCPMIHRRLLHLSSLVPPRIHAAVLHTIFNGWTTHRRFQKRRSPFNKCVFQCNQNAEDSLEHYCRCDVVLKVARNSFRITYPAEQALSLWALASPYVDIQDNLISVAVLQYGVYNAFNTLKHAPVKDRQQAFYCILQHCRQGVFGHAKCMQHFDSRWNHSMSYIF